MTITTKKIIVKLNYTALYASRNKNVFTVHLKESMVFNDLIDTGP